LDGATEHIWQIYDNISELIRFSDTKAVAILASDGVVAGLYFSNTAAIQNILTSRQYVLLPLTISLILLLISGYYSAACLFPRIKSESKCNLIFFSDIVSSYNNPNAYEEAIKKACQEPNCETIQRQLLHQIWQISQIAQCKYSAVKQSVPFFVASLAFGVITILALAG
jgi:hypothetical protein